MVRQSNGDSFDQLRDSLEVGGVAALEELEEDRLGGGDHGAGRGHAAEGPLSVGLAAGVDGVVGDLDLVTAIEQINGRLEDTDVGLDAGDDDLLPPTGGDGLAKIVIAGFSMGGAIVINKALTTSRKLAGLMALSTYLPIPAEVDSSKSHRDLPVFMGHGTFDPMVQHQWTRSATSAPGCCGLSGASPRPSNLPAPSGARTACPST